MLDAAHTDSNLLSEFFQSIYGENKGYVYLAFKNPKLQQASWKQEFFAWPDDSAKLEKRVLENTNKNEVYYGPALYREPGSATKDNLLGSQCFWVEFDGNVPEELGTVPEPSIRVQSSSDKHQHWYWKSEVFISDIGELERVNRTIAYALSADISGWDATQVLRPPNTRNHKRDRETKLLKSETNLFSGNSFSGLSEPPILIDEPIPESIPPVDEVVFKYKFKPKVKNLFTKGPKDGDRSDGLMTLGYYLAEMQLKNEEILSMLLNADARWGKFAGRNDQIRRLNSIVTLAIFKYPPVESLIPIAEKFKVYGLMDLLQTKIELEWIWDGLLQTQGFMLLTGAPKIGKTQFSLCFAIKSILGQNFLDRTVSGGKKIGFLSLEMGLVDLKYFLQQQSSNLSPEQLKTLQENLRIMPLGEPHYLSREAEQEIIEDWISDEALDGIIIDSLGSTTEGELGAEEAKSVMDWNDRMRQSHKVFTWFVHHHRKASGDNKKPNKLDDIYGSRYITARCTSALTLWETSLKDAIQILPLAVRLAKRPEPFYIKRDSNLHFDVLNQQPGITKKSKGVSNDGVKIISNDGFTPIKSGLGFD